MFEFDPKMVKNPNNTKMFSDQKADQVYGCIKNRTWDISPGQNWNISMIQHGVYTISHPIGTHSYSLNYNLLDPHNGKLELISMCDKELVFHTYNKEGSLADLDFLFCMSTIRKIA